MRNLVAAVVETARQVRSDTTQLGGIVRVRSTAALFFALVLTSCLGRGPRHADAGDDARPPRLAADPFAPRCRFAYVAEDRGLVPRSGGWRSVEHDYGRDPADTVVASGDQRYRIRGRQRRDAPDGTGWRIRRDSGVSSELGWSESMLMPKVLVDGEGAMLVAWSTRAAQSSFAIVTPERTIPLPSEVFEHDAPVKFVAVRGGWLVAIDHQVTDTPFSLRLVRFDTSGAVVSEIRLPAGTDVGWTEGRDGFVYVAGSTGDGLRFGRLDRFEASAPLATVGPPGIERARDVVRDDGEGFWIVSVASWQYQHDRSGPEELRAIHVRADGSEIGRVNVPFDDAHSPRVEHVRVEDGSLLLRVGSGAADTTWRELAIVDVGRCEPPVPGPCDPTSQVWTREIDDPQLPREDPALVLRIDATLAPGERRIGPAVVGSGRTEFVAVDANGAPSWRSLDASTNDRVVHPIDVPSPTAIDLVVVDGAPIACIGHAAGLALVDATGMVRVSTPNPTFECSLVRTRDHLVAIRHGETRSGGPGPRTESSLLVFDPGTLALVATRPGYAHLRSEQVRPDADGAWVVVRRGHQYGLVRFDRSERAIGSPRLLATLYHYPATRIVDTPSGLALEWWSSDTRGVVPFCFDGARASGETW